jgi:hypothetical protein
MNSSAQVSVNLRSFLVIVKFNLWNLSLLCWNPFFFFWFYSLKKTPILFSLYPKGLLSLSVIVIVIVIFFFFLGMCFIMFVCREN